MQTTLKSMTPEWSFFVEIEDVDQGQTDYQFNAEEDEMAALARRFDVIGMTDLKAKATVKPIRGGDVYHVSGLVTCHIEQQCTMGDDTITTHIEEPFEGWFTEKPAVVSLAKARQTKDMEKGDREVQMVDEQDDPEPIRDGRINIAELAAQYALLSLDPYAKHDDAPSAYVAELPHTPLKFKNPFAGLQDWKDKFLKET